MSEASSLAYPLPSSQLRPSWKSRVSQVYAAVTIAACLAALVARAPIGIAEVDDVTLRILLPAGLAFVLSFAPTPGTAVGRIARGFTVVGLAAAMFAGNRVPVMLACYPLVLMTSVAIDWAGPALARRARAS
jgi:hypothetical protein